MNNYVNGLELGNIEYTDNNEVIEGLLPLGVSLLAAPQKLGKTLFALQLANAIAKGDQFHGYDTSLGKVLYLAFEDSRSNVNKRFIKFGVEPNVNLDFIFSKSASTMDVEYVIDDYASTNQDVRLVVIDTFAKIRKSAERDYHAEYKEVAKLHDLAIKNNLCIMLVTHITKQMDYNNPFDSIYGSRGITAASDSMMVMLPHKSNKNKIELHITGKDIASNKICLKKNDNLVYEIIEDVVEETQDEILIKVIHFTVTKKDFEGTNEELCALLNLPITARGLASKLKSNMDVLAENFIEYTKCPRTAKARKIRLRYTGDDDMTV